MTKKRNLFLVDFSPFDMEIITKIPMSKLVYVICEFYWSTGHQKITLEYAKSYVYYNPEIKLKYPEKIKEIRVSTRKGPNKQKFDSIYFNFQQVAESKTKIIEKMGFGFRIWHYIYILTAFLISVDYLLKPFTTGMASIYFFLLLLIPLYTFSYFKIKRTAKHPAVAKYKEEFEEFIREKENEIFSDYK
jgi:hypothetical protein